ncbi:MAG: LamG domain-containing protein [Phycisphaerae bacterium]|nr:LamG domain-containing protein [Phycisphaerae bacterium]
MITRTRTVLTFAAVAMAIHVLTATSANARIILEEQFIYESAMLDTLNGGTGFDGPWVATKSHGRDYYVGLTEFADQKPLNADSGLSFSTLPVAGSALSRYGSAGRAEAHRMISAESQAALTQDNTTIWFSQLFAGPAANRNGVFIFGTQSIKHTDNPYELSAAGDGFGFATASIVDGVGGNGDGSINAIAFDNSITATFVKGTYTPDPTTAVSLIVGKINWKPNGTPDEFFLFNVTDLSTEPAESEAFASITNLDFDQSAFNMIAMYDGTNSVTDEIRFGTSFADVMGAVVTSSAPSPADGALYESTWANLTWRAGSYAISHDIYFGTSFDDVNNGAEGTFVGNLTTTSQLVGFFGFPAPDGLVPGTTYYWRVDERNDADPNSPWKGDVWSFLVPPTSAYEPSPSDGAKFVRADAELSWTAGMNAKLHYIHFGDNSDDVNNATAGTLASDTTYAPGTLELGKTYYWRVDESNPPNPMVKGDVWSFTIIPDIPIIDPNLVGWWKFEAGADNEVIDFSGHGNHGTIVDKVLWVPGQFNMALEFFGDNQGHVELPALMVTKASGSVAMWVNTNQTGDLYSEGTFWYGAESADMGFMGFGDQEIHIHSQTSGALGFWMGGATSVSLDGPMLAGTGWNHVAVTWDQEDGCRLYCNGVQADFQVHNGKVADLAVIRLGRPNRNFRFLKGFLDDVRLFDHAITAEQVNEIMTKGEDPLKAGAPSPGNGAVATIDVAATLTWSAGEGASQHGVYFGVDRDAVANATADSPEFQGNQAQTSLSVAGMVEFGGGDYYWRVDEIAADGAVVAGAIWKFTVPDYLIADDFEPYNDINEGDPGSNRVYLTWIDGFGTTTNGSQAGNLDPPFMSQGRNSAKAMPLSYDNAGRTSEATRTLVSKNDWTRHGVTKLLVWFSGDSANAAERMFVALGNAVVYHPDDAATQEAGWNEWVIDLQEFTNQGVNLSNVGSITLGFGTRGAPVSTSGAGTVHFDDIRLIR